MLVANDSFWMGFNINNKTALRTLNVPPNAPNILNMF